MPARALQHPSRCRRVREAPRLTATLVVLAAALVAAPSPAAAAPSNGTTGDWTLVGFGLNVTATARLGNTVYLGGSFNGFARRAVGLARVDAASLDVGRPANDDPSLNDPVSGRLLPVAEIDTAAGHVTAMVAAPDGGAYVAGAFRDAAGTARTLVRLSPQGTVVESFRPPRLESTRELVRDMALRGNRLYLAGGFSSVDGAAASGVAVLDAATGSALPWRPRLTRTDVPAQVSRIAVDASGAYVIGDFTNAGSNAAPRTGTAQLSLTTGEPTAWNPNPNSEPSALALDGPTVYLGGSFTSLGGDPTAPRLAAVDATTGAVRQSFAPKPNAAVTAIDAVGSTVYVAGRFSQIAAQPRSRLAALDAADGAAKDWRVNLSETPTALLATGDGPGDRVYLGLPGGGSEPKRVSAELRCGLAAVDAAVVEDGGVAKVRAWDPRMVTSLGNCGEVSALAAIGTTVFAAGTFIGGNVLPRRKAAAFDVVQGEPTDWRPQVGEPNGPETVNDMAVSPNGATVYLGGSFSTIGWRVGPTRVDTLARSNAAAVSAAGVGAVNPSFNPSPTGPVQAVAVTPTGNRVYLGGRFLRLGGPNGPARPYLAWVNPTSGAPSAWAPDPDAQVNAIALASDGRVFAGGDFATAGAQSPQPSRPGVAAFDPMTAQATAWAAGLAAGAKVASLALAGDRLYVGGLLTRPAGPGEPARGNIAAFDPMTAALAPFGPSLTAGVTQLSVAPDGTVYVFGAFTTVNGVPRARAASFARDGTVTGWAPTGIAGVTAPLQFVSDRLLLGGAFGVAGGRPQGGFGVFGPAVAPRGLQPPRVSALATPEIGNQLECAPGRWEGGPLLFSYTWLRDGVPVAGPSYGAAATTYTITDEDGGTSLTCEQTGLNAAGQATRRSAPPGIPIVLAPPTLVAAPVVGGEPWVGGVARCSTGLWRNGPTGYAYGWLLDGVVVPGQTAPTFAVGEAERGRELRCRVVARNASSQNGGRSAPASSPPATVTGAPPRNLVLPSVAGDTRVGGDLRCDPGVWSGGPSFAYAWLVDGDPLAGATAPSFAVSSRELGRRVLCRVSGTSPNGRATADSAAVLIDAPERSIGSREPQEPEPEDAEPVELLRLQVRTDRTLVLSVAVPRAGSIDATATARPRGRRSPLVVGRGRERTRSRRTLTVRIAHGAAARRALRRAGRRGLRFTVTVRFTPRAAGPTLQDSRRVTVRPRASRSPGRR